MKIVVLAMAALLMFTGCADERTTRAYVTATDGKDGTNGSCSVAPEYSQDEISGEFERTSIVQIGARITCNDGSSEVIYNGEKGDQGDPGKDAKSCRTFTKRGADGVYLQCPGQRAVFISDGKDGDDCRSVRQDSKKRVKITCGRTVSYVYDGKNGRNGTSCTVDEAKGGAMVTCGESRVYLANGRDGQDGLDSKDGEDAVNPGLSCNVHDLSNWNGITNIFTALSASAPVGNFTLANLNVGNSPSANGFPGMPSNIQNQVGLTGYALDCSGYINVNTSGIYSLSTLSDDGIRLAINDQVIINNPGLHAPTLDINSNVTLNRGFNRINVIYYQGPHTQIALQLKWSGPNLSNQTVPASALTH